jgi:cupin fold WbuC family metalloprotein
MVVVTDSSRCEFVVGNYGIERLIMHQGDDADLHSMMIKIGPGTHYPYHLHLTRDEVYCIISGELTLKSRNEFGDESVVLLKSGHVAIVESNTAHCVSNCSNTQVVFLEVRRGPFDPNDTVREF